MLFKFMFYNEMYLKSYTIIIINENQIFSNKKSFHFFNEEVIGIIVNEFNLVSIIEVVIIIGCVEISIIDSLSENST